MEWATVLPNVGLGSGWALAALFGVLVYRGHLVPRKTHEQRVEDIAHDRNEWRAESRIKDAQIAKKDEQLGYMREVGEANRAVLTAIQQLGRTREQP